MQLGPYVLGSRKVTVIVEYNHGNGGFSCNHDTIIVGLDQDCWWECLSVLLHEAMEMAMTDNRCRYDANFRYGQSHDSYIFVMTHPQYSEVCGQVGNFLAQCVPDVSRVYNQRKKQ